MFLKSLQIRNHQSPECICIKWCNEFLPRTIAVSRSFRREIFSRTKSLIPNYSRVHYLRTLSYTSIIVRNGSARERREERPWKNCPSVLSGAWRKQKRELRTVSYVDRGLRADGYVNCFELDQRATQSPGVDVTQPRKRARGERLADRD